jgi:hypothetical protein
MAIKPVISIIAMIMNNNSTIIAFIGVTALGLVLVSTKVPINGQGLSCYDKFV